MDNYKPDTMLYHANCADGFGAAWAAWMLWGDEVEYVPVSYGQEPPNVDGQSVLIGDFSFKKEVLSKMAETANSIIILDHHKTAEEELQKWLVPGEEHEGTASLELAVNLSKSREDGIVAIFDMDRSGARMVWEFCHPSKPVPRLIQLIEDRDLWRFQYEDTKPFGLWLRSEAFDFEQWAFIDINLREVKSNQAIMSEAKAMQRFFDQKITEIAALSRIGLLDGHHIPLCNCPPMFASDVGHFLLDKYPSAPFAACYSDQGKAKGYSLRSRDDRHDVSEIARKFGGGGHRNAAGFGVPLA